MIEYKLVRDYRPVKRFLREKGQDVKLHFPTVAAYQDGEVIGVLSNRGLGRHGIWLGPLVVDDNLKVVPFRLAMAMDNLLTACGVTMYFFATEPDGPLYPIVKKFGLMEELDEPDEHGHAVFLRRPMGSGS